MQKPNDYNIGIHCIGTYDRCQAQTKLRREGSSPKIYGQFDIMAFNLEADKYDRCNQKYNK